MTKWVTKKLGDLGYSFSGLSGKTINDFGSGKPFIPYMNIFTNGKIDPNQLEYVHIEENERQNKVEKGDWFFTTSSETPEEVGMTSVLVDDIGEAYLNSFCFGFRLYNKNEFDPEFASYLFRSKDLRKRISLFAQGSTRYNLPKQQMFEKLYITYPESLAEQRRIAGILSSADGAIAASEALIEKYRNIKRGLLSTLLQPKEGWKKVKLGECCEIGDGLHGTPKYDDTGEYYFINGNNIKDGIINIKNDTEKVDEEVYNKHKIALTRETILMSINGTIGNLAYYNDEKVVLGKSVAYFMIQKSIIIDYLYYYLQSCEANNYFDLCLTGSTIKNLGLTQLRDMTVYLPDLAEQRRIADILSSVDAKIAAEEKVVEKYKGVKKGLMEEMMKEK